METKGLWLREFWTKHNSSRMLATMEGHGGAFYYYLLVLLPGLPAQIASKLHYSKVVVVSLYTGTAAGDRASLAQARSGAREVGAGFAAVNVLDERQARAIAAFGGPVDSPAVLIVRRPGKIATQFTGSVDDKIVAQAAHNAGAGR